MIAMLDFSQVPQRDRTTFVVALLRAGLHAEDITFELIIGPLPSITQCWRPTNER